MAHGDEQRMIRQVADLESAQAEIAALRQQLEIAETCPSTWPGKLYLRATPELLALIEAATAAGNDFLPGRVRVEPGWVMRMDVLHKAALAFARKEHP